MENQEKIYCGSAKIVPTQYGELTKISFHKDDINRIVSHMKEQNSDWCNLVVKAKKDPPEGKPTHYLEVDMWKPELRSENQSSPAPNSFPKEMTDNSFPKETVNDDLGNLPF